MHKRVTLFILALLLPLMSAASYAAGAVQMSDSNRLKYDSKGGKMRISPAKVKITDAEDGDFSDTYIVIAGTPPVVGVSMVTVVCLGGNFAGYTGFSHKLDGDSSFDSGAMLAMGYPKRLIVRSFPWLFEAGGLDASDEAMAKLCSAEFRDKVKAYNLKSLPKSDENSPIKYAYNARKNVLDIQWANKK